MINIAETFCKDLETELTDGIGDFAESMFLELVYSAIENSQKRNEIKNFLIRFLKKNEGKTLIWNEHWEGNSLFYVDKFLNELINDNNINVGFEFINGNIIKNADLCSNHWFSLETVVSDYHKFKPNENIKPDTKFFIQGGRKKQERSYILDLFKSFDIKDEDYIHTVSNISHRNGGKNEFGEYDFSYQKMSDLISKSFFYIACETMHPTNSNYWFGDYRLPENMCFTEKISYPIIHKKPFFLINTKYSLYNLRQLGFKTFSNIWSEDYDNCDKLSDRIDMIFDIILWLNKLNEPQINKIHRKASLAIQHNFELINKMQDNIGEYTKLDHNNFNFKNPWQDSN